MYKSAVTMVPKIALQSVVPHSALASRSAFYRETVIYTKSGRRVRATAGREGGINR
jgi:hypothetical protein